MARKPRNKEPSILRTSPDGTKYISREWIGWAVIAGYPAPYVGLQPILDAAAKRVTNSKVTPAGQVAVISDDGRAIISFVDKEV